MKFLVEWLSHGSVEKADILDVDDDKVLEDLPGVVSDLIAQDEDTPPHDQVIVYKLEQVYERKHNGDSNG